MGGFGFLGELWSSILSSCLMEQEASVDNVKGCERLGWLCPCQTSGTGMKLGDYSLDISQRRQIEKGGKILANNSCLSPVFFFFLAGASFPYQPLAVFLQFFPLFSNWALKPADLRPLS